MDEHALVQRIVRMKCTGAFSAQLLGRSIDGLNSVVGARSRRGNRERVTLLVGQIHKDLLQILLDAC